MKKYVILAWSKETYPEEFKERLYFEALPGWNKDTFKEVD